MPYVFQFLQCWVNCLKRGPVKGMLLQEAQNLLNLAFCCVPQCEYRPSLKVFILVEGFGLQSPWNLTSSCWSEQKRWIFFFLALHTGSQASWYHRHGNYGTLLLNCGSADLLVVAFESETQASFPHEFDVATASLPSGRPKFKPRRKYIHPYIYTYHTFQSLSVVKFKAESKNSLNTGSIFCVLYFFGQEKC